MRALSLKQARCKPLWVRVHPGSVSFRVVSRSLSVVRSIVEEATSPRGVARSTRHPVTVEIGGSNPLGDAFRSRRASDRTGRSVCSVESLRVGWALASPGGRNPPALRLWRFNSVPTHFRSSDRSPMRSVSAKAPKTVRRAGWPMSGEPRDYAGTYVSLTVSSSMRSMETRRSGGRGPAKNGVPQPSTKGWK